MPIDISIGIEGDRQVERELLRGGDRAMDLRPAFEQVVQALYELEARQFASQGSYASGGWAPRKDRGDGHRLLDKAGDMLRSFTQPGGDNVALITDEWMTFGSTDPKAHYHQTGTSRMPRRRPLELRATDRNDIVRVLQRYITTGQTGDWWDMFSDVAGALA